MKTKFLTILATLLIFSSCSSDDEANQNPNETIIGEWTIYKYTNPEGTFESDQPCGFNFVEFHTDNTYHSIDYVENSCEVFEVWDGTWAIHANALILNNNTEEPATIQAISTSQMILSYPESNETIYYKR